MPTTSPSTQPGPTPATRPTNTGPSAPAVEASNAFAFDLYHQLATKPGNLAYSPASISIALSMTYAGAHGDTASEMEKVLHLPKADALAAGWATAIGGWQNTGGSYEMSAANRLFGEKSYTFEKPFLDNVAASYGAPLDGRDFKGDPQAQRAFINGWVKQQTRDRIVDLIPPPGITRDTRLVLVNALYLKAAWTEAFSEHLTKEADFFAAGGKTVKAPMMNRTDGFKYAVSDGAQILEMPYKGEQLAMVVVLPEARDGLGALEKKLSSSLLSSWIGKLKHERVWLSLPRFKVDPAESIDLADTLKAMGMPLAFDAEKADFTGIANPPSPADRLYIGHVFHKAFVAVDEKGTEAAAATAVVMPRAGGMPSEPARFEANHPFLFFIRDVKNDAILFVGRVENPTAS